MTLDELDDCLKKATKFKRLRQTLGSTDSTLNPSVERILEATGAVPPFFVVAFENKIALRTLFERLKAAEPVAMPEGKVSGLGEGKGNSPQPPIDCVCCCPALKMTMTPSLSMKTKMVALVATLTG